MSTSNSSGSNTATSSSSSSDDKPLKSTEGSDAGYRKIFIGGLSYSTDEGED